jgi:hypothetical protein
MSNLFVDDPGSAFSVMRCVESANFASMAIMSSYVPPLVLICITAVASVASFVSILRMYTLIERKKEADPAALAMTEVKQDVVA